MQRFEKDFMNYALIAFKDVQIEAHIISIKKQGIKMASNKIKQLGQGMTEYIIIVALIAIVAITVFNIFGDTVRGQVGDMAAELGGGDATGAGAAAATAAKTEAAADYGLTDFKQTETKATQ